jgi:hypothetical protein
MLLLLNKGNLIYDFGVGCNCIKIILGFVKPSQLAQKCNRGRGYYDLRNPSHLSSKTETGVKKIFVLSIVLEVRKMEDNNFLL